MATNRHVLGLDSPMQPPTPRTPGHTAIKGLVQELSNKFGVEIAPHDSTVSPAQQLNRQGIDIYNRIRYLYWQDRDGLYAELEIFKSDLEQDFSYLNTQRRTELLSQRLNDKSWLARERIKPTPTPGSSPSVTPAQTPTQPRTLPPESYKQSPSVSKYRSRAEFNGLDMPPSPLARKSIRRSGSEPSPNSQTFNSSRDPFRPSSKPLNTDTSFADSAVCINETPDLTQENSQYGSWLGTQDLNQIDPHYTGSRQNISKPLAPITCEQPLPTPSKRRKSDDSDYIEVGQREPASDAEPQVDGKRKTSDCHWKIKALPEDKFSAEDYPFEYDTHVSYAGSVERARLVKDAGLTYEEVASITNRATAKSLLTSHGHAAFQQSHAGAWKADAASTEKSDEDPKLVQSAMMTWNTDSESASLLNIVMQPARKEARSNYLERHFGWDRLLTVTFPSFTRDLPKHLSGQQEVLRSIFESIIIRPKKFMGRIWCGFHTEDIVKKLSGKRVFDTSRAREVTFFALSGDGIDKPMSRAEFMDWMTPFAENAYQPVCKLYKRIDLFLSRTIPTVQLQYHQIRWIEDIAANDELESTEYNDPAFGNTDRYPRKRFSEPMSDGCGVMSVGLARRVCREGGIPGFPSTFQGRIGGYEKGTWLVNAPYDSNNPEDLAEWIQVRPSQIKVKERPLDKDPVRCEDDRWTFNVVDWSKPPRCSDLHRDFLQLLEDRHVPRATLKKMIDERIEIPLQKWSEAMHDPARFVLLRDELFGWSNDKRRTLHYGLPHTSAAKTQLLVDEAGFFMKDSLVLVEAVGRMQDHHLQKYRSQLRFTCPKSTIVVGIADPFRVVRPGTIYFSPSQPLVDQLTGEVVESFAGQDILVSRHPSQLNSDIQKVKCVYYPQLAHIKDTVVMATRGQVPLAAMLQGGDYDGDKFWLCVDQRVVQPFLNAPVLEQRRIDYFGIKQEKRSLEEIVGQHQFKTDEHVESWLRIVLPFACREKQLGTITNYLKDLAYHFNDVKHAAVRLMADLHGHIIDADKNGYEFDFADFQAVRRCHQHLFPEDSKLRKPAYQKNIEAAKFAFGGDAVSLRKAVCPDVAKRSCSRILDDVVFNIVNPKFYAHLEHFHRSFAKPAETIACDKDLTHVHTRIPKHLTDLETEALGPKLADVYKKWSLLWTMRRTSSEAHTEHAAKALRNCIDSYNAIRPTTNDVLWNISMGPDAPTFWDCFKVAILARDHYVQKKSFMLWVALDTVCFLKGLSKNGRDVITRVNAVKKPKEPKDWAPLDEELASLALREGHDELLLELDDEYFDELG